MYGLLSTGQIQQSTNQPTNQPTNQSFSQSISRKSSKKKKKKKKTHWLNGEEFCEVWLRVSEEGAVPVGMMGETLGAFFAFRTRQQDSNLRRPNVIWEILIGCRGSCDYLHAKRENITDKIISPNFRYNILCLSFRQKYTCDETGT